VRARTIVCYCAEGDIAAALGRIQDEHRTVEIGSYPFMRMGTPGTSIVFRSTDEVALARAGDALVTHLAANGVRYDTEIAG
jgi:hypothetical protein